MNGEDLYDVIIAINVVIQEFLTHVIAKHALQHVDSNSPDPNTALAEVLITHKTQLRAVKSTTYKANIPKIFKSSKRDTILPSIEIINLDSSLLLDILLGVEDFLKIQSPAGVKCKAGHIKCCNQCNHSSKECNKCKGNNGRATRKCHHKCMNCPASEEDCLEYSTICCTTCNLCKVCNKKAFNSQISAVIQPVAALPITAPCVLVQYLGCLNIFLCFRNIFGHVTYVDCQNFLDKKQKLGEFQNISTYKELQLNIKHAFSIISNHRTALLEEDIRDKFLANVQCIFDHKISLQKYVINLIKLKEVFQLTVDMLNHLERYNREVISVVREESMSIKKDFHSALEKQKDTIKEVMVQALNEHSQKESLKEDEQKKYKRLNLEKTCGNSCLFSLTGNYSLQKQNILSFQIIEIDDTEENNDHEWCDIENYEIIPTDGCCYFLVKDIFEEDLLYSLKMALEADGKQHNAECKNLLGRHDSDCHHISSKPSKIFLIAHNDGKKKNVHSFENKIQINPSQEFKSFCQGADVPATTIKEFKDLSKQYLENSSYVERFPPSHWILHQPTKNLGDMFKELFNTSINFYKVIITGQKLRRQMKMFGFEVKKLGSGTSDESNSNCILIIDHFNMVILNIRVANNDVKSVKKEISRCNDDLMALRILHEEKLKERFVTLHGLVACPMTKRKELKTRKYCYLSYEDILFLCEEDLQNGETLKQWWRNVVLQEVQKYRKRWDKCESSVKDMDVYKAVAGETMATMALIDIRLPRLTFDVNEQVTTLLLNKEQLQAMHSSHVKKIICGPFGSGKSLILKGIAEHIFSLEEPSVVYYICCDPYSLLEAETSRYFLKTKEESIVVLKSCNIAEMAKEAKVNHNNLPEIINYFSRKENHPTNFLIDEADGEIFTTAAVMKFKEVYQNRNIKHVAFAVQSIEKERSLQRSGEDIPFNENQFEETGMKIIYLTKSMRMTASLNKLNTVAQECIQKSKTSLVLADVEITKTEDEVSKVSASTQVDKTTGKETSKNTKKDRDMNPVASKHKNEKDKNERERNVNINSQKERSQKKFNYNAAVIDSQLSCLQLNNDNQRNMDAHNSAERKTTATNKTERIPIRIDSDKAAEKNVRNDNVVGSDDKDSLKFHDLDAIGALYVKSVSNETPNESLVIQTHIKCIPGVIGHNIKGGIPNVIFLDKNFSQDSAISAKCLSFILQNLCLKNGKKTSFICNSLSEATLACYALDLAEVSHWKYFNYLLHKLPTNKEKEDVLKEMKNLNVLVTDHRGFRGCESEHCITFINQEEIYTKHVLVEILARAISHIDILVLPITKEIKKDSGTLLDVIHAWEEERDEEGESIISIFHTDVEIVNNKVNIKIKGDISKEGSIDYEATEDELKFKRFMVHNEKERGIVFENSYQKRLSQSADDVYKTKSKVVEITNDMNDLVLIPPDWEDIDFLHPSCFGSVIGKGGRNFKRLEKEYGIELRVDNKRKKIQIKAETDSKEMALDWFKAVNESRNLDVVLDYRLHKSYSKLVGIIERQIRKLQNKYNISIFIDKKTMKVSIKGDDLNKKEFKVYLKYQMLKQERNHGTRYTFYNGLSNDDRIILEDSDYPSLRQITTSIENKNLDLMFYNVNGLKSTFIKTLKHAHSMTRRGPLRALCCIMFHVGKMFSKLQHGEIKVSDLVRNPLLYKRLLLGDLQLQRIKEFEHLRKVYRYDITFFTPEPVIKYRYRLYVKEVDGQVSFITNREAGDRKPEFSNVSAGPGYFDIPNVKISRLDIVDPNNGLTTRVSVQVYEENPEFKRLLKGHMQILQTFFNNIKLKKGTTELILPEMPPYYLLCYYRYSERNTYKFPGTTSTILTTSEEKVLINYEGTDAADADDVVDVFVDDIDILNMLDYSNWTPEQVVDKYENVLKQGHNILQKLI